MRTTNRQRLDCVHRRAARLISNVRPDENINDDLLLSRAGLIPLTSRSNYRLARLALYASAQYNTILTNQ